MKKGAIFDMDGLMFDTETVYQATWHELAEKRGITLDKSFAKTISGTSGEHEMNILREFFKTDDPEGLANECVSITRQKLSNEVPLKLGIKELLTYLKNNGCKLAVASSTELSLVESNLRVSNTDQYFDEVISGAGLEHGKPAPDVFLLAASRLGLDAKDCYVFEDSINGVKAGIAAGCTTIMVPDLLEPTEELKQNVHIYSSLLDALEAIKQNQLEGK